MSLAIQRHNGSLAPAVTATVQVLSPEQIWDMAERVSRCGMYSIKSPEQAYVLMSICQAKGLNAIEAVERYDIIQGRPAMKAVAIAAEFQKNGGRFKILERSAKRACAVFSHPELLPDGVELSVTLDQFRAAGLTGKDNWKNYPEDMLWWRLVVKGVRTVYPGVILGIHSEHEAEDVAAAESPAGQVQSLDRQAREALAQSQTPVYGGPEGFDDRPYSRVATEALQALNAELAGIDAAAPTVPIGKLHGFVRNAAYQANYAAGVPPTKSGEIVRMLDSVYKAHPDWLRRQVNLFAREAVEAAHGAAKPAAEPETGTSREAINAAFAPAREPGDDDADPDVDYPEGT